MLLPKEASSRPLPCSAKSLHWEQPCDHTFWTVVTIKTRKRDSLNFIMTFMIYMVSKVQNATSKTKYPNFTI